MGFRIYNKKAFFDAKLIVVAQFVKKWHNIQDDISVHEKQKKMKEKVCQGVQLEFLNGLTIWSRNE